MEEIENKSCEGQSGETAVVAAPADRSDGEDQPTLECLLWPTFFDCE